MSSIICSGKIVKLEENLQRPLSFRAAGAWTAPMSTISSGKLSISDWKVENVQSAVNEVFTRCELDVGFQVGSKSVYQLAKEYLQEVKDQF